ncbi:unnamed protein product [Cylicocyclus nassatus]|uniref:RxLR effector protein n=1 Tax=Cylicocyclus nassatus TaxID=53992 RepID=A0AA36H815_CYLNA|nr:unnamed protein product [Cylicocyclus nassatus]
MNAVLLLVALFLSCQARLLDEERRSSAENEDGDIHKRDMQGEGEEYRARKSVTVMKRSDMRVSAESESTTTTAKTESTTTTQTRIYSETNANVPKGGGLWDNIKNAASSLYKSAKDSLANLANQFSSWLKGVPTNGTLTTTTAHVIKRKSVDDEEDEQEQNFGSEHEEGDDVYRRLNREQTEFLRLVVKRSDFATMVLDFSPKIFFA